MDDQDELDAYLRRSPLPARRAGDHEPTWSRVGRSMAIGVALVTLIGTVFAAGFNWRDVAVSAKSQDAFAATFQRKDVADEQYKNVLGRIDDLKQQNERLQASVDELLRDKRKD